MRTHYFALLLYAAAAAGQTAVFPGAVVTDNQLRKAVNDSAARTTLAASMTNIATSFQVANAAGIVVNSVVTIDSEKMAVCQVAGSVISVGKASCPNIDGRGFDSTSVVAHANGAAVRFYIDPWFHNAMAAEMKAVQTLIGVNGGNLQTYMAAFPIVSVKAAPYSCAGDGSTDDTTCFTNAVAGGNKHLFVPEGTYLINSQIAVESNTTIECASPERTVLKLKSGSSAVTMFRMASRSNVSFRNCTFDGNYPNVSGAYTIGLYFSASNNFKVEGNRFRYWGYADAPDFTAGYHDTHSIFITGSRNGLIKKNRYNSNFGGFDVQIQATGATITDGPSSGIIITDEQMGVSNLSDGQSNVNWWDTQSATAGYYVANSTDVTLSNNQIFGGIRLSQNSYSGPPFGKGGAIRFINVIRGSITGNVVRGLTVGYGTVSVTQGSPTVTGTNTLFSTLDPLIYGTNSDKNTILIFEGSSTEYKFDTVLSTTSGTLTANVDRGLAPGTVVSGLRYWIASSGDLIGCSPCQQVDISGNVGDYSGDMGLSLGKQAGAFGFNNNTVSKNTMSKNRVCGAVIENNSLYNLFDNQILINNHQAGSVLPTEYTGAYCFNSASDSISYNSFTNTSAFDDQGSPTQVVVFDFTTGTIANMAGNYLGTQQHNITLTSATAANFAAAFNGKPRFGNFEWIGNATSVGTTYAGLGTPSNGNQIYCSDCAVTSEISNVCTNGGTGAWATRLNGAWRCQSTQDTSRLPAYNPGGTLQTAAHAVFGKCTLGTDCAVTLTGAAAFSSSSSYYCGAVDQTAAAAVKAVNTSGSTVTFTGTGTDVISFVCIGN